METLRWIIFLVKIYTILTQPAIILSALTAVFCRTFSRASIFIFLIASLYSLFYAMQYGQNEKGTALIFLWFYALLASYIVAAIIFVIKKVYKRSALYKKPEVTRDNET